MDNDLKLDEVSRCCWLVVSWIKQTHKFSIRLNSWVTGLNFLWKRDDNYFEAPASFLSHLQFDVSAPPATGRVGEINDPGLGGDLEAVQEGEGNAVGTWGQRADSEDRSGLGSGTGAQQRTLRVSQQQALLSCLGVDAVKAEVGVCDNQLTAAVQTNAVRTTAHGLIVRAAACNTHLWLTRTWTHHHALKLILKKTSGPKVYLIRWN